MHADGQIALKLYDEITLTRALSTALASLRRRGLDDQRALQHLMAFVDGASSPPAPLLLIGANAFSEDDSLVLGAIARDVGFKPVLLPHVLVQPPLDAVASGAQSFDAIIDSSEANIAPATDNRPYFFQFEKGIPSSLAPPVALALAAIAVVALAIGAEWRRGLTLVQRGYPLLFAMLGVGFIALEIYAIQQTRLFLGHPTVAITIVLVTFLVGGGLGSGLSQMAASELLERRPQLATASVLILSTIWSVLWIPISALFLAETLMARALIAALSLLPLALCMGVPFPQALKLVGAQEKPQVALAWSINGLMTVVGSILAVALSITLGYSAVLWLGASAYLAATAILAITHRGSGS